MATKDQLLDAAIALTRFGVGARSGDIERLAAVGPREALQQQLRTAAAFSLGDVDLPSSRETAQALAQYRESQQAMREAIANDPDQEKKRNQGGGLRRFLVTEMTARLAHGATTDFGLAERLVWFWSNHFTVAAKNPPTIAYAGPYEREAIRANMTGSFADLHLAVMRHPGMLLYLDQVQSIGPNSRVGERRDRGLNENLAREALELHTLGPQGGYTQEDVTEFARALTGWTIVGRQTRRFASTGAEDGDFVFSPALHEPGARRVLGKTYKDNGEGQARAIIEDLALHPKTARRIAEKLARAFIADSPPESAIARLEATFLETKGDLPSIHRELIDLPESWRAPQSKFKSPNEFIVSAYRAVGLSPRAFGRAQLPYLTLGETPFTAPSPEGWPIDGASWMSPDALVKRLEWAQFLAGRSRRREAPADIMAAALGPLLSSETAQAIRRAESSVQGLALGLMSPDFQRR